MNCSLKIIINLTYGRKYLPVNALSRFKLPTRANYRNGEGNRLLIMEFFFFFFFSDKQVDYNGILTEPSININNPTKSIG